MIEIKLKYMMSEYSKRVGKKLTYKVLAEETGIAKATIESIGSRPDYNATLDTIDKLCGYLRCSVEELLEYRKG